jgi:hypothetical protein
VLYRAEKIITWRTERINGTNVPTMVALQEEVEGRGMKDEGERRW